MNLRLPNWATTPHETFGEHRQPWPHPGGTLPQAFPEWKELKAAYRLFGQRGVRFEQVPAPHLERTRRPVAKPGSI